MLISEIITLLDAKILTSSANLERNIVGAFSSDMMSDVLAHAAEDMILITGLTNMQTVRTAEMVDIPCILYVRSKAPDASVIALAEGAGITVLTTPNSMFITCGMLYELGFNRGKRDGK